MKRIATLFLAIVMLVSVMAPISAFADASTNVVVTKLTNADNPKVEADETWVLIEPTGLGDGGTVTVPAGGWTSANGMVTLSGGNLYKVTNKPTSNAQLNTIFGGLPNHFFTQNYGVENYTMINTDKVGIKGAYTIELGINRFSSSGEHYGFEIKTASMAEPLTVNTTASSTTGPRWVDCTTATYSFSGVPGEYVKIFNPQGATGHLRFFGLCFKKSTAAIPVEEVINTPEVADDKNSAVFNATDLVDAYYDVNYYYTPSGDEATAPTLKFDIINGDGTSVAHHYYNTGDGSLPAEAGYIYLGAYKLSGAAKLDVTKVAGSAALTVSSAKFTPNTVAVNQINPVRITDIYKKTPDIIGDRAPLDDANDKYRDFLGQSARKTTAAGVYEGYSARDYNMVNGTIAEGYYDVSWYAIVDDVTAGKKFDAYIYHNGVKDYAEIDYTDLADGTKKWINLGTYKFAGNNSDEYISVGSKTLANIRLGGFKFVPVAPPEDSGEIIVDVTMKGTKYFERGTGWDESGSIKYNGGATRYVNAAGRSAEFMASDLEEGTYAVYYYHLPFWRTASSSCTDSTMASFVVNHNGVTDGQLYDNTSDAADGNPNFGWKYMGTYDFAGTGDESVVVTNMDAGKSMRTAAVKFVKVDAVQEFVIPAVKNVESINYKVISDVASFQPNLSDAPAMIVDGLLSSSVAEAAGKSVKVRYYLPNHGLNTAAGKYEVSYLALPFNGNTLDVTANIAHNGETDSVTFNNMKDAEGNAANAYEWRPLGQYDFLGGANGEYVEFDFATGTTRYSAVKFTLIKAAEGGADAPELSGKLDCEVTYNNGIATIVGSSQAIAITAKVTNGLATDYNDTPVVYAAVYDKDWNMGAWVKLDTYSDNIKSGKTAWYSGRLANEYTDAHTVVTYVWDSNLKPLTTTFELPVTAPVK